MSKVLALTHIYYNHSYNILKPLLLNLSEYDTCFLFSISLDCVERKKITQYIYTDFPNSFIIETPNIGKDIGGKLALLNLALKLNLQSDYMVLLHDKVSPQELNGLEWRDKLLKIIDKETIKTILNLFETNTSIGIIASEESISDEYSAETGNFSTVNNKMLQESISLYNIKTDNYKFVAGTMFWTRNAYMSDFFKLHPPIEMRKRLEHGNVLDNLNGTFTHTVERLFGLIAGNYGYKIQGV